MLLRLALLLGLLPVPTLARADPPDLWVADYACAREISDRNPVSIVKCASFDLPGPAYLWVQLRGNATALKWLENGRDIVVLHKWVRFVGPNPEVETIEAEEEIPAGTINAAVLNRLRNEVAARGYFDWRTWTSKSGLRQTRYSVDILNEGFGELPCGAVEGAASECGLHVTIRGRQ